MVGAALIAAIGLLLAMPGGSDRTSTALSPLAQAAERTAAVPGGRFSGTGTGSFPGGSMTMSFQGVYNGQTNQSSMTADMHATGGGQSLSTTITGVQDGLVTYMTTPLLAGQLPNGAHWMKIDLTRFSGDVAETQTTGAVDGQQMLDTLGAVSDDARVVGTERIRGVKTTQYVATIDPTIQAQQLRDEGLDSIADTIEEQPPAAVSVWVDAKGMVRRMAMDMPFAIPGQAASRMSMSFDFYDFGIKPQITIPPSSDTFDATELSLAAVQ